MKKLVSLTLVLAMMFSLGASALAADISTEPMEPAENIVNEYDMYVKEKQKSRGEYSVMNIDGTEEKTIEELYLERAALSEEELIAQFGYSKEQIAILKSYDGSPIENNPQLRAVSASYDTDFTVLTASTTEIGVEMEWEWSQRPLVTSTAKDDYIVCDVAPIKPDASRASSWKISPNRLSLCTVYYAGYTSGSVIATSTQSITEIKKSNASNHEGYIVTSFKQAIDRAPYDQSPYWAKKGIIRLTIIPGPNVSYTFAEVVFGFIYTKESISAADILKMFGGIIFSGGKLQTVFKIAESAVELDNYITVTEAFEEVVTISNTGEIDYN